LLFLLLALSAHPEPRPRVINADGHPAYTRATEDLKQSGELGRRCRCRASPYLNNILEQDHRFIKKRAHAGLGFRSAEGAWRTIEGYEAMHAIYSRVIIAGTITPARLASLFCNKSQSVHTPFSRRRV
jgi:transposase-like protein